MTSRQVATLIIALAILGPACGGGDGNGPSGSRHLQVAAQPSQTVPDRAVIPNHPIIQLIGPSGESIAEANVAVTVRISSGGGLLGGSLTISTAANGQADFGDLTISGTVGVRRLEFSAEGFDEVTSATINLVAGTPAAVIPVGADTLVGRVGQLLTDAIRVKIIDLDSNAVGGVGVQFTVQSGGGTANPAPVHTNPSGIAESTGWRLGNTTGPQELKASVVDLPVTHFFVALAGAGPPALINIVAGDNQHTLVGTPFPVRPSVRITDEFGNPKEGIPVHFETGIGTLSSKDAVTDQDGLAVAGTYTPTTVAQDYTILVTCLGLTSVVITAYADAGPPVRMEIFNGFIADFFAPTGFVATDWLVQIADQYGNVTPGVPVTLTPSAGGTVSPTSVQANNVGRFTMTRWTLPSTVGNHTLTFSSGAASLVRTVTTHRGRILTRVSGDSQSVEVGTPVAAPLVVRLTDSAGTPVPGVPVRFEVDAFIYSGSISTVSTLTDVNGLATSQVWTVGTDLSQGSGVLAQATGIPSARYRALLRAGPPVALRDESTTVSDPYVGTVLQSAPVVKAVDRYENPVSGLAMNWQVNGGGSLASQSAVTDIQGIGRATWTLGSAPATQSVDASVAGLATPLRVQVSARPGPPDHFELVAGGGQSAAVRHLVTITPRWRLVDRFQNPMPSWNVRFEATNGGQTGSPAAQTDNVGEVGTPWTLGPIAGAQSLKVVQIDSGTIGTVTATATPAIPATLTALNLGTPGVRAGLVSPIPLGARVTDADGIGVAGVTVNYAVTLGTGSLSSTAVVTDSGGVARLSGWTIGAGGNAVTATVGGLAGQSVGFTATGQPATSSYNVRLNLSGNPSAAVQQAFLNAAARWSDVIVGDLPDQVVNLPANACYTGQSQSTVTVDDLLIFVLVQTIDGPGGILGGTGACVVRGNGIPLIAVMVLDGADLAAFAQYVPDIVLHEMGHAIGIGPAWQPSGLVVGAGGSAPRFLGPLARTGYWVVRGGSNVVPDGVPLETNGGQGTRDVHWSESAFGSELMTGFVNTPPNPMSLITTGSLQDLGYQVNNAAADLGYTTASLRAQASRGIPVQLREMPRQGPVYQVTPDGTLIPR